MKEKRNVLIALALCFTLGLAPFIPEPHIWQKLNWIASGATGMKAIDWFDALLHGFPWVLLFYFGIKAVFSKKNAKPQ